MADELLSKERELCPNCHGDPEARVGCFACGGSGTRRIIERTSNPDLRALLERMAYDLNIGANSKVLGVPELQRAMSNWVDAIREALRVPSGALPPEGQITGRATPVALRSTGLLPVEDQGAAAPPARVPDETEGCEPLQVECARCGKPGTSETFMVEEGDEWECPECWERCEAEQRYNAMFPPGSACGPGCGYCGGCN